MEWLNYHHLLYFWTVAKEGSITRACERLRLAQPTISGQLRALEENLQEKLFRKSGRGLVLTETGQVVFRYADEIFGLGKELQDALKNRTSDRPLRLHAGISDLIPKLIAYRILQPALAMREPVQLICTENAPEHLLVELADHRIDVVISDAPITSKTPVRAFNHLLGSCGVSVFAARKLASQYQRRFPASLNGAPFLLPMQGSGLRSSLDHWFEAEAIHPRIIGEFKDSALMKTFGQAGAGIFFAPSAIEKEVKQHYNTAVIGRIDSIVERFYAISVERRLSHPAVLAISAGARGKLFSAY